MPRKFLEVSLVVWEKKDLHASEKKEPKQTPLEGLIV